MGSALVCAGSSADVLVGASVALSLLLTLFLILVCLVQLQYEGFHLVFFYLVLSYLAVLGHLLLSEEEAEEVVWILGKGR